MTTEASSGSLILPLLRPEYMGGPEALLTSLAWSCANWNPRVQQAERAPDLQKKKALGLAYEDSGVSDNYRSSKIEMVTLAPGDSSAWRAGLASSGVQSDSDVYAQVLARAIRGVVPTKGRSIAAAPLTPHVSLMQNAVGLTRKAGPFNVGFALEQIYALGSNGSLNSSAAGLWLSASQVKVNGDPLLQALDQAAGQVLLQRLTGAAAFPESSVPSPLAPDEAMRWTGFLPDRTPFRWFHESWNILMTPEWAAHLPPRVWVDWATAVLRLTVGFAYLWEAAWYERVATILLNGEPLPDQVALSDSINEVLPWRPRGESVSVRDVVAPMRARIARGVAVRRVLIERQFAVNEGGPDRELKDLSFGDGLLAVNAAMHREGDSLHAALTVAMTARRVDNAWEAVRYVLATRSESGGQADFFGLLRNAGNRYAVAEPGTEWTALLAGLAARTPGGSTTVAHVLRQLAQLGLHPPLAEVIALLEEAGLARGSADADQAVSVQSPF